MITDEELEASMIEVEELAGIEPPASLPPDSERIDRIVEKAMHEAVIKDTTSFVFLSFTTALAAIGTSLIGGRPVK